MCWAIQKARNKACFEKIIIKDPIQIIYHICALMKYWAGLYCEADKEQLEDRVNTMLQIANQILKRQKKDAETSRLLPDGDLDGQGDPST